MPNAVTDTHALIWYLQDDKRLTPSALEYFERCEHDGGIIHVPAICVVETLYLSEKGHIPADTLGLLLREVEAADTILNVITLSMPIIHEMRKISRRDIPDMPDRIIAATASYLTVPLISRDSKIRLSAVETVW